jgi:cysteine synthase A
VIFDSVRETIGHTPLVRLNVDAPPGVEAYAKLELQNLFAMKDRVARNVIREAQRSGALRPGAPIVESSSGTMALGLALVGRSLGHPVHIVTDPRIDPITQAKLVALGCAVHVVEQMNEQGWQGARLERLQQVLGDNPGAYWTRQYANEANPGAYRELGAELLADLGHLDVLVGAVGSGGSLCGTARALRESLPGLRVVGVDAVGSVLFGQPDRPRRLQSGLGNSIHPDNLDADQVDEVHWLSDAEAFTSTRELAHDQQIFAGNTSGSVYRVLREVASRAPAGTRLVGIMPDRGDRYVDSVYSDKYWAAQGLEPVPYDGSRARRVRPGTVVTQWSYRTDRPGRTMLFVESNTSGTGMTALTTAAAAGLRPVLLTSDPDRYAGLDGTGCDVLRCETNDIRAVRAAVTRRFRPGDLAGVTTTSEYYLPVTAALAEELGLPGNDTAAMALCRDKAAVRDLLSTMDAPAARYRRVSTPDTVPAAVAEVGLPCVVKPVDESGSLGVRLCATVAEARQHAARLLRRAVNGRRQAVVSAVLVEEFLDGPEYSVEIVMVDGAPRPVGITEKTVTGAPYFVESRHVYPAALPAEVAEALYRVAGSAVTAAGVTLGPVHVELRLTSRGPIVVEVNARLAGGRIPEVIRLATGLDLVAQQINLACAAPVDFTASRDAAAGIAFLTAPEAGTLAAVHGVEAAAALPGVHAVAVTATPGTAVAPPVDGFGRIGHVIATGGDGRQVADTLSAALAAITVKVRR